MDPAMPMPTDPCQVPMGQPPDNQQPNFENPVTLGPTIVSSGAALCSISTVIAAGRFYNNRKNMHSADWFTVVGVIINIGFTGVISAQHRTYRHMWDVPLCWYTESLQMLLAQSIISTLVVFFSKAAILLLYRQLFAVNRQRRIAINIGIVVTFLTCLFSIPMVAVYTAPHLGQSWDELLLTFPENARSLNIASVVQGSIGTLIDLYILVLPLPILLRLNMPRKRVLGLVGIFSTGLLGVGASVASLAIKTEVVRVGSDLTWQGAWVSLCVMIETNISIVVGCMPAFASLLTATLSDSQLSKSLRSRISGWGRTSGPKNTQSGGSGLGEQGRPVVIPFEDRQPARREKYYQISDDSLLMTPTSNDSRSVEEHELQCGDGSLNNAFSA